MIDSFEFEGIVTKVATYVPNSGVVDILVSDAPMSLGVYNRQTKRRIGDVFQKGDFVKGFCKVGIDAMLITSIEPQ